MTAKCYEFTSRPGVAGLQQQIETLLSFQGCIHPSLILQWGNDPLVDRFMEIVGTLETAWQRIPVRTADPTSALDAPRYANCSLYADVPFALQIRELMSADPVGSTPQVRKRIRGVVGYCAKLGGRRRGADDLDLFTVLPTAS